MTRFRPVRPFVALAGLGLVLAACTEAAATPSASPTLPATPEATASATAEPSSPPAATESAEAATEEVSIEGSRYVPSDLMISAGTEVTFVNRDSFAHTVTEGTGGQAVDDPVADENVGAGESVEVRFDEPGTYQITCRFHPTMQMTIVVEG